jgi:hypothetical protein
LSSAKTSSSSFSVLVLKRSWLMSKTSATDVLHIPAWTSPLPTCLTTCQVSYGCSSTSTRKG